MTRNTGWRPIPLSLKIVFVLSVLWIIGSLLALPVRIDFGLPFFSFWIAGLAAGLVVVFLDIIGPLLFIIGLWKKKSWTPKIAYAYMTIFVLNTIVSLVVLWDNLLFFPLFIPALATIIFLLIIYGKRDYFA